MTIEQLAEASETGSKGHLSNIERGLVRPNIYTLQQVADGLGVKPLDLLTFPKKTAREKLIDATRSMSNAHLTKLLKEALRLAPSSDGQSTPAKTWKKKK